MHIYIQFQFNTKINLLLNNHTNLSFDGEARQLRIHKTGKSGDALIRFGIGVTQSISPLRIHSICYALRRTATLSPVLISKLYLCCFLSE